VDTFDTFFRDLRYAARMVMRMRGAAIAVTVTLGIGIAGTTTMFSAVYGALLRPLPFDRPGELVVLNVVRTTPRDGEQRVRWSFPETVRLAETLTSFQSLGTFTTAPVNLTDRGEPEQVDAEIASRGYFEALRVSAERGRVFDVRDERAGAPPVALLGAGLWRRRYGADASIVGRTIAINEVPLTIVGVLPEGFAGLTGHADVWFSPAMAAKLTYAGYLTTPQHFISVIGRLRAGRSLSNANAEVASAAPRVVIPEASAGPSATWRATAVSLSDARIDPRSSRQALMLFAAVACVLLITCVNVASVLLARGRSRRREIAVRMAIGSGRFRVVRQLLTEAALLALMGGVFGVLLTLWAIDLAASQGLFAASRSAMQPIGAFARPSLDTSVLLFAAGISLLTTIACGLVPAIETTRTDLVPALKEDTRSGVGRRHSRVLAGFVVCELSLAVLLLVMAGLLVRSFVEMQALRAGFSTDGVITFWVAPPASRYAPADGPRIIERLLARVQQVPGIVGASVNRCTPFNAGCARTTVFFPEHPTTSETAPVIGRHYVSAGYFRALGIPLRAGRTIADDDAEGRSPVVVVNDLAARRFWPNESPIGKRVWFGPSTGFTGGQPLEVVGVVGDVKYGAVDDPPTADFYTSYRQFTYPDTMVLVKTTRPPGAIVPALRAAVASVDAGLPIYDVRTLDERIAAALSRPRLTASVLAAFAVTALVLAAFGVYGVMAHSVAMRRQEIGIRMALGANRAQIMRRVLAEGGRYVAFGLAIGLTGAIVTGRLVRATLAGVVPNDPSIFAAVVAVMALAALVSTLIPARRASAVDPAATLRAE